jgi:hypothetical protein
MFGELIEWGFEWKLKRPKFLSDRREIKEKEKSKLEFNSKLWIKYIFYVSNDRDFKSTTNQFISFNLNEST